MRESARDNINADHNFHFWQHKFVLPEFITNSDTRSNFELLHAILKATRIDKCTSFTVVEYFIPFQLCCLEDNSSHKVRSWSEKDMNVKTSPQAKRHRPSLLFTSLAILNFIHRQLLSQDDFYHLINFITR